MREIIPLRLWIGNVSDTDNPAHLIDAGVLALVDLAYEEKPPKLPRDLIYCRFPLVDGSGNSPELLKVAIETIANMISQNIPTIVFCGAGMSRSPCVVAAALSRIRDQSVEELLLSLTKDGAHDVSVSLLEDIKSVFKQ